jgi:hypothetical protein
MKIIKPVFLALIAMLLFSGCTKKPFNKLETYFAEKQFVINLNDNTVIVFIPVEGCHTCVNKAIDFMKAHPKYPFHYVLSSVLKRNLQYISETLTEKPDNLYLDYDNTLMMHAIVNRTPKAYFLNKNKITFSLELSTEENYLAFVNVINKNFGIALNAK